MDVLAVRRYDSITVMIRMRLNRPAVCVEPPENLCLRLGSCTIEARVGGMTGLAKSQLLRRIQATLLRSPNRRQLPTLSDLYIAQTPVRSTVLLQPHIEHQTQRS